VRIGCIADSHDTFCEWGEVLPRIATALQGVDAILHCGDVSTAAALDDLEALAPVQATRSEGDEPAAPPRWAEGPRVVDVGPHAIGLSFERPAGLEAFERPVEAVVFGSTHASSVEEIDGVLWVNPGSPSLAEQTSVAILTVGDGPPRAEIIPLI
jgi:putative phosphoesterase